MATPSRIYVALGDSMSIDDYTGVDGGGAAAQFHRWLAPGYRLVDRTFDGCTMPLVPRDEVGDVLTLTIGGNDLLPYLGDFLASGSPDALDETVVERFASDHLSLLRAVRSANPDAALIVGDIYRPAMALPRLAIDRLVSINACIRDNVRAVDGRLAEIHSAFAGQEESYLTLQIEPTLAGATAIARCFEAACGEA